MEQTGTILQDYFEDDSCTRQFITFILKSK